MYLYSSRKLLLIVSNLTLDAVMLTVLAEMTVALCPSFVSRTEYLLSISLKLHNLYMGLSVLFFVCLKKLTTTQTSDHKRRVIAKLAICKNNGFFMKWEKVMESNSLEKEQGV